MDHSPTDPHPLDYNATISRMEPGIAPVASEIALASIAISLKEIAHYMRLFLPAIDGKLVRIGDNIAHRGGELNAISNAINGNTTGLHTMSHILSDTIKALNHDLSQALRPPETME